MMAKVVTPIAATVEHITAPKDGQYGPYQSVLFKTGQDEKIWKSFAPDSAELTQLQKGVRVQLIPAGERNGKPSHQIVLAGQQAKPQSAELDSEAKLQVATYVQQMSKLYAYCYEQAAFELAKFEPAEESVKCAASSLFIAAQRKFGL